MAVYVDNNRARFGQTTMCHMIADTTAELLEMACRIGLRRKWIQNAGTHREHFDVSKKEKAIDARAIEISANDLVGRMLAKREHLMQTVKTSMRLVIAAICVAVPLRCQQYNNCKDVIADDAGVLRTGQKDLVDAAEQLGQYGADVKILTTDLFDETLRDAITTKIRECPEWAIRKDNLLVLAVAPKARKTYIFPGPAVGDELPIPPPPVDRYKYVSTQYMAPAFRIGNWAGGFLAAEREMLSVLKQARERRQAVEQVMLKEQRLARQQPPEGIDTKVLGVLFAVVGLGLIVAALFVLVVRTASPEP